MSCKLLSVTKQISNHLKCVFILCVSFLAIVQKSTKSNRVQIILWKANIICPALKINGGKAQNCV